MERLTSSDIDYCERYCDMDKNHCRIYSSCIMRKSFQKLKEYEDLEEQGLLLRLPCKVGDTVYKPNPITLNEIVEIKIESIFIIESKINISGRTTKMKYSFCCSPSDIGKTVFLTKVEARQKLKEMERDNNV